MWKLKYINSQIVDAIKRVEAGFAVPGICRELSISTATFYKWRLYYPHVRNVKGFKRNHKQVYRTYRE